MKMTKYVFPAILFALAISSCDKKVDSLETEVSSTVNRVSELEDKLADLENQISLNSEFEKEMRCQEMLDRLKKRWNNVVGCYYDSTQNTCMVAYKDNGKTRYSQIEHMVDGD